MTERLTLEDTAEQPVYKDKRGVRMLNVMLRLSLFDIILF